MCNQNKVNTGNNTYRQSQGRDKSGLKHKTKVEQITLQKKVLKNLGGKREAGEARLFCGNQWHRKQELLWKSRELTQDSEDERNTVA